MRIAIASEQGMVFQHFGKCPFFTIYEIQNGTVQSQSLLDAAGSGHSALAGLLKQNQVELLICGGIGQGAKDALAGNGIGLICGVEGSVSAVLDQYRKGSLLGNPDFVCGCHGGSDPGSAHKHEGGCHCGSH